jgi:hypothetical protein
MKAVLVRNPPRFQFEGADVIPAEAAPALVRFWNALGLVQTELLNLKQCGDLASTLRLTEYWGDYFL